MPQAVKRKSLIPIPVTTNTDYRVSSSKTPRITSAAKAATSKAAITAKSAGSFVSFRVTAAKSTSIAASSKAASSAKSTRLASVGQPCKPCICTTCCRSRSISPRTPSNTSGLSTTTYSNDRSNRLKPPVALLPASAHGRVRSPKMSQSPRGGQARQPKSATKLPVRSSSNIRPTLNRVGGKGSTRSPKGRMSLGPSTASTGKGEVKVRVNRKESLPSTSRSNPKYISPSSTKAYQPTQNGRHSTFTKIATKPGTSASLAADNVGTKDEDRVRPGRSTSSFSIVPNIPLRSCIDVVFRCPQCSREVTECYKYKVMITECNHMICHICLYQAILGQSGCPICKQYLDHFNHRRAFVQD